MRAGELDFRLMVGAFHGHAHNRKCQLDWHPMYIPGTGHTEGEGCEHIFSSSNELARSTRHASPFHRRQTIEEHFSFWDTDKYATLSE
jgi:Kyakuja-Dileera-Zisupton transposase